jgi:hypothetical protein
MSSLNICVHLLADELSEATPFQVRSFVLGSSKTDPLWFLRISVRGKYNNDPPRKKDED